MKQIPLTHNLTVTVDDQDFERMNAYNWYVTMVDNKQKGVQNTIQIVRDIQEGRVEFGEMLLEYDKTTQYLTFQNHNRLDFRRENLLLVPIELAKYHKASATSSNSKYKGVHYDQSKKRYIAKIQMDGKPIHIGSSPSEDEAARMYNRFAKEQFGKYAFQNIIGQDNRKPVFESLSNLQPRTSKKITKPYRGIFQKEQHYQVTIGQGHYGTYKTPEDAAYAYNQKAKELYGENAILNVLPKDFVGQPPVTEIHLFGNIYKTYDEVAKAYGLPKTTLHNRLRKMTLEEAVQLPKSEPRFRIENISIRQLALDHQINRKKLADLLKDGYSVNDAIKKLKQN